jgi:hypothetical protein
LVPNLGFFIWVCDADEELAAKGAFIDIWGKRFPQMVSIGAGIEVCGFEFFDEIA